MESGNEYWAQCLEMNSCQYVILSSYHRSALLVCIPDFPALKVDLVRHVSNGLELVCAQLCFFGINWSLIRIHLSYHVDAHTVGPKMSIEKVEYHYP